MNEPSGKSREEICLQLAKLSEQSIEKRKDIEWKVNLGFWTALGVFTWFATQSFCPLSGAWLGGLCIVYLLALIVWICGWQIPLHAAHQTDRDFKHYYADKAQGIPGVVHPQPETAENPWTNLRILFPKAARQPWMWGQVLMTTVFFILSIMVLWKSDGGTKPETSGDVLRVSGKNLEITLNKLAQ
jgi:hypothetical protein